MLTTVLLIALSLVSLTFTIESPQDFYQLILLPTQRGASCLDGSPSGFYYHQGSGANKNKFMVYFQGGSFCTGLTLAQTIQSCYKRSFTSLGSTANATATRSFKGKGVLSPFKEQNPVFFDWTKINVIYCDGSEYSGTRDDPISYKDRNLYFRGYNNTMQLFRYLDTKYDFYNGQKIVINGVSAGGIATYLYSPYLQKQTKKAKIYAIPDSGYFITEYFSPIVNMQVIKIFGQNLFKLINDQSDRGFPIKECYHKHKDEIFLCYNAVNLAQYLSIPIFIVQSPYDQWSLKNIIIAGCLTGSGPAYSIQTCNQTTRAAIQDYRTQLIKGIKSIKGSRKDVGVWGPACVQHGFIRSGSFTDPKYTVPSVDGPMAWQAIQQFLQKPQEAGWYLDEVAWPLNKGCNGLETSLNLQTE